MTAVCSESIKPRCTGSILQETIIDIPRHKYELWQINQERMQWLSFLKSTVKSIDNGNRRVGGKGTGKSDDESDDENEIEGNGSIDNGIDNGILLLGIDKNSSNSSEV